MAEMIPTFTGPNYLGQAGATIAKFDETSAARLKAMLDSRTDIMQSTMSNLDRIAHTAGVNAPDRVLTNFGLQPAFGGPEAEQLQALYKAGLQADIAATGRSGRGGGGGGATGDPKSDEAMVGVYVTNADGTQTKVGERRIKLNGYDTFANNLPAGQSARIETTFAAPATSTGSDGDGGAQTIPAVQGPEGTAAAPSLATSNPHGNDVMQFQQQTLEANGFDTKVDGGTLYVRPQGGSDEEWKPM
jgi:hypothetical protein